MGSKYNNRVQDRIHLRDPSTPKTLPKPIKSEPARAGIPIDHRDDLKRGSDRATDPTRGQIFSTLFLVPKKDGGQRQVINLKSLNSFINAPHFKMEGIHKLKPTQKRRLACKDGLEGRLYPEKSTTQKVSLLPIQ